MSHDDGVRWVAEKLYERIDRDWRDARERYMTADSGMEEEYWRGQSEGLEMALEALEGLAPRARDGER